MEKVGTVLPRDKLGKVDEEKARMLVAVNAISEVILSERPEHFEIHVKVKYLDVMGDNYYVPIETQRGGARRFTSLDTAWRTCKKLGVHKYNTTVVPFDINL